MLTNKLFSFKASPDIMATFDAIAEQRGLNRSALCRLVIYDYVAKHQPTPFDTSPEQLLTRIQNWKATA
jgi:antitoxin component of RelBE/YafQ-DinJ toxin-antitoxin module